MAIKGLSRLASKAPVPIFPAIGPGASNHIQDLKRSPALQWVRSPRQARILLVAGNLEADFLTALFRVHDQIPKPMATLWWRCPPPAELASEAIVIEDLDRLVDVATATYRSLLLNGGKGEPNFCPNEPPEPWEGLGDHGQGGEGMMGGKPYGRPMAMPTDDLRDGLQLDPLSFSIGPFTAVLPPGLSARLTLHGDVIAEFEVASRPYPVQLSDRFRQALEHPVEIADLEMARAEYHLRQLSHALWINGLESLSLAVLKRVHSLKPGDSISGLYRWLNRTGFFSSTGAGKGVLSPEQAEFIGGPAARAAGLAKDARLDDPGYQQLGFEPVPAQGRGCESRWRHWLDETEQALALAKKASSDGVKTLNRDSVESPRGRLEPGRAPTDASSVLQDILPGMEWSEAVATIASLDLAAVEHPEGAS